MAEENPQNGGSFPDGGKPTLILRTWERTEAEIIKGILEENGITCMLSTDIAHTIYPFTMNGLGEIRVYVPEEKAKEALEIIRVFSEHEEGSDPGSDKEE